MKVDWTHPVASAAVGIAVSVVATLLASGIIVVATDEDAELSYRIGPYSRSLHDTLLQAVFVWNTGDTVVSGIEGEIISNHPVLDVDARGPTGALAHGTLGGNLNRTYTFGVEYLNPKEAMYFTFTTTAKPPAGQINPPDPPVIVVGSVNLHSEGVIVKRVFATPDFDRFDWLPGALLAAIGVALVVAPTAVLVGRRVRKRRLQVEPK